jgi:hypothetical protein
MVYFQTNYPIFGKLFERLVMVDVGIFYGHLVNLWQTDKFNGQLVDFVVIWYIFSRFGRLNQEKSGNPAQKFLI